MRNPGLRTRSTDTLHWWDRWLLCVERNALLIVGMGLVITACGLIVLAVQFYSSQALAQKQNRTLCERTKVLAPYTSKFFDQVGLYPDDVFVKFNGQRLSIRQVAFSSVPKTCR